MKTITAIVLVLTLAGCATPHDLMQQPADLDSDSTHSVREVTACIGEEWSKINGFTISSVPTREGYMMSLMGLDNVVWATVAISERGEGSHVRYKEQRVIKKLNDKSVKNCANNAS